MSSSRTDSMTPSPRRGAEHADGRPLPVLMPQMGVSVAEGTIVEWRKQPGDWVEADETVCDMTTDKIDIEIPSPASGRLAGSWSSPARRSTVGTPLARIDAGRQPGEAHPDGDHATGMRVAGRGGSERRRRSLQLLLTGRAAHRRGARHRPLQVQGTGIGGRIRKRDVLASSSPRRHRVAAESRPPTERPLHIESPYQAGARPAMEANGGGARREGDAGERREPMSPMRQADRAATWSKPPHGGPLHDGRRGGLQPGGRAPAGAQASRWRGAASPHLPRLRRAGDRGRARRAPGPERVGRRRRDRLPRRCQPGHRGGARRGADRAGDPPSPAPQPGGPGGRDRRPRRPGPGRALQPDDVRAERSRSPTRGSSARCWRRRSSTSRRWRSSTWRRS